jgi:hypothetical protein
MKPFALLALAALVTLVSCEDALTPIAAERVRLATLESYTLLLQAPSDGSIGPSPGSYTVKDGEAFEVTATANAGFSFLFWEQTGGEGTVIFDNANNPSTRLRVSGGNAAVRPRIDDTSYVLTVTANPAADGNAVSVSSVNVEKDLASGTISATPGPEYNFTNWTVSSGSSDGISFSPNANSASVTVTASAGDATLQANFTKKSYTLTVQYQTGGYGSPNGSVSVVSGANRALYAYAYGTYIFDGWEKVSGAGTESFGNQSLSSTTVNIVGGSATIRAKFRKEVITLTQEASWNPPDYASPLDVADAAFIGNYLYWVGPYQYGGGIVRRVNLTAPANPITSSSDYKTFAGTARNIVSTGASGSETVILASSTNRYRISHGSFTSTGLSSVTGGLYGLAPDGNNASFWAVSGGIASLYSNASLNGIAYMLEESGWSLEKLVRVPDGLIAVAEDNQWRNLVGFAGPEGGGPVSAADSFIALYQNGDMYGGSVGRLAIDPDQEYLTVPIYEDDQYLRLKTYDITSLSALNSSLRSSLDIGSDTDYATGATFDDEGYHYAYVAGSKNGQAAIWIVDLSNVLSPIIVGGSARTISGYARAVEVFKRGSYLYVLVDAAQGSTGSAALRVLRIDKN